MNKIAILTQPLKDNYGGLLQAYALKIVIEQMGENEVYIINRLPNTKKSIRTVISYFKNECIRYLSKLFKKLNDKPILPRKVESNKISVFTNHFKKTYISDITKPITSNHEMKMIDKMGFDSYIVGSDQVWRPKYSPNIYNYFLDFTSERKDIKRIAYAASFGVDHWEFSKEEEERCVKLSKNFNAISVREDSGIKLCKKYLGVDATLVLDPTILLTPKDYNKIIISENEPPSNGKLMSYVLDENINILKLIKEIENLKGLQHFTVMRKRKPTAESIRNIKECIYPSPTKWIKGFSDAKFVVTDSFHGTIFSILYNVPFIVVGNKSRGLARFESILKMFGLEDRLILNYEDVDINIIYKEIEWERVNEILDRERKKSLNFIKTSLAS